MLFPALLDAINAPSEKVVVEALTVQASIAEDEARFRHLMQLLLDRHTSQSYDTANRLKPKHVSTAMNSSKDKCV